MTVPIALIFGAVVAVQGIAAPSPKQPAVFLALAAKMNGLEAPGLAPWHVKVHFERRDGDGDVVESGTYEEFWVSAKKYKREYASDVLSQTDYANDRGLFRVGKQDWPGGWQVLPRQLVVEPVRADLDVAETEFGKADRPLSGEKLDCITMQRKHSNVRLRVVGYAIPYPHYCFAPGVIAVRFSSQGGGDSDTAYNDIVSFQDRYVARDIRLTNPDKSSLNVKVEILENLSNVGDADFAPPTEAVGPLDQDVMVVPAATMQKLVVKQVYPDFPSSVKRPFRASLTVQVTIGKNGRVISAKASGGLPEVARAVEEAFRNCQYRPFLVRGEPVVVQTKFTFEANMN